MKSTYGWESPGFWRPAATDWTTIDDGGDSSMIVGEDEGDKVLEWVGRERDRMVADVDASFWGGKQKKRKGKGFGG